MDTLSSIASCLTSSSANCLKNGTGRNCVPLHANSSMCRISAHYSSFLVGSSPKLPGEVSISSSSGNLRRRPQRAPSALLNAAEFRKQKSEKSDEAECGSESDDDLCPVECVREFKNLDELESVLHESKDNGALVVVDYYRTSCGSCRYIEKGFVKLCKGAGTGEASVIFLKHNVCDSFAPVFPLESPFSKRMQLIECFKR